MGSNTTPFCGTDCGITIEGTVYKAHQFSIKTSSNEIDVRAFGDGDYGAWLACAKNGTIDVKHYGSLSVEAGDTADITANVGSETWTMSNAVCTAFDVDVDAKGIGEYTHIFRITGDVNIV